MQCLRRCARMEETRMRRPDGSRRACHIRNSRGRGAHTGLCGGWQIFLKGNVLMSTLENKANFQESGKGMWAWENESRCHWQILGRRKQKQGENSGSMKENGHLVNELQAWATPYSLLASGICTKVHEYLLPSIWMLPWWFTWLILTRINQWFLSS